MYVPSLSEELDEQNLKVVEVSKGQYIIEEPPTSPLTSSMERGTNQQRDESTLPSAKDQQDSSDAAS